MTMTIKIVKWKSMSNKKLFLIRIFLFPVRNSFICNKIVFKNIYQNITIRVDHFSNIAPLLHVTLLHLLSRVDR